MQHTFFSFNESPETNTNSTSDESKRQRTLNSNMGRIEKRIRKRISRGGQFKE